MKVDLQSTVPSIIAALVVSLVGGSASMFISWKLIEQRMHQMETRIAEHDSLIRENRRSADDRLEKIANDVSYLRGRAEGEMGKAAK